MMSKFWDRVHKCKHEINPNYCEPIYCDTLFCRGVEVHCMKCGVYISHCDCFANDGMSGWPTKRWNVHRRKRINRIKGINYDKNKRRTRSII